MFPRGGGVWDQDPILMRDFRLIQKFEREWKENQQRMEEAKSQVGFNKPSGGGGIAGIGDALNQFIEESGEDAFF